MDWFIQALVVGNPESAQQQRSRRASTWGGRGCQQAEGQTCGVLSRVTRSRSLVKRWARLACYGMRVPVLSEEHPAHTRRLCQTLWLLLERVPLRRAYSLPHCSRGWRAARPTHRPKHGVQRHGSGNSSVTVAAPSADQRPGRAPAPTARLLRQALLSPALLAAAGVDMAWRVLLLGMAWRAGGLLPWMGCLVLRYEV